VKRYMLRACPFCGSDNLDLGRTNPRSWWVGCEDCGAAGSTRPTRGAAADSWNAVLRMDLSGRAY
jgi:Lar family restriction alleviation protein